MVESKQANKLLAMLLIVVMLLTNPMVIGPLYAASRDNNAATNSTEQLELNSNTEMTNSTLVAQSNDSNLTDGERFNRFINQLIPYYVKGGKKHGPEWLKTTDISFSFTENYKPMFTLTTIQPFAQADEQGQLWFWQGRYAHQIENNTANLGVGWRKLSPDKQQLVGLNLFYDYGFKNNLSRMGTGLEYFNKLAEYRANLYLPLSGDRQTGVSYLTDGIVYSYIRAVRGFDYEVGTSFEHARWLSLYATGYFYDNQYKDNEVGYKLRSVMQLTPRFSAEVGYDKSNLSSGSFYGKVLYQLGDGFSPALSPGHKEQGEKKIDLTYKLLQKVERNNTIKTETFTKFVSYQGSMRASVTNAGGQPLQGVRVQAYQNGNPVGAYVVTDSQGNGIISGLNVGNYTVRATYFSYTGTSSVVTVQKDQMANVPAISLPVVAGNAIVHVLDSNAQGVSGVSVTAEMVSSQVAQAEKGWFDRMFGVQVAHASAEAFTITLLTQADGTVQFKDLPPGVYRFTASYNNQVIKSISVPIDNSATTKVTAVVLNPPSSSYGSAAITVKDSSERALADATVSVSVNGDLQSFKTTANGIATFKELPAGTYNFVVTKENYNNLTLNLPIINGVTANGTVNLSQKTGSANITVTDGSNILADATVTVVVDGSPRVVTTNSSGVATFRDLPVGNYTFSGTKQGYTTVNSSVLTITNGNETNSSIALSAMVGNIAITVSTNDSSVVTPIFTVDGVVKTATNSGNVYTLSGILVGSHTVAISGSDYITGVLTGVNVTGGNTTTTAVTLSRQTGEVAITVNTDDSGVVTPSFTVDGVTKSATQAGNVYTISGVTTGSHRIEVAGTNYTTGILTGVSVTANATTSANVTLIATIVGGNVAITVNTSDSGTVAPTFAVDGISVVATNSGNVYTLAGVSVGSHTITITGAGYTVGTLSGVVVTNRQTTTQSVTLAAIPGSVAITVSTNDSGAVTPTFMVDGVAKTATNSGNVYTLSGIPAGSHNIMISGSGYTSGTLTGVNVTNNTTTAATVTLNRQTGSVAITVNTDDSGAVTPVFTVDGVTKSATQVGNIYTISGIATGSHRIEVAGTNYTTGVLTGVNVTDNATTPANITLVATIVGGSVAITVSTSDSGSVVPSFAVDGISVAATNSGNVYTLTGVSVGSHSITVAGAGYTTGTLSGVSVTNHTTTSTAITLAAIPGNIAITVSTSDSSAVTPTFTVDGVAKVATNSGNVYTLSGIGAGNHTITVAGAGYTTGTLNSVSVTNNTTTPTSIMLAALPGSVAITVATSDSGAVTPSFTVDGVAKTATSSGNVYTLSGIAAGSHTIEVSGADYTSQTVSNVMVTKNAVTSQSISLVPLPGSVAITVLTNDGGAVTPTFTVDGVAKTATSSGNVYTLSGIVAGSHSIEVSGADYTAQTLNNVSVVKNTVTPQSISLVPMPGSVAITLSTSDSVPVTPSFTVDGVAKTATKSGNVYTLSGIVVGSHNIVVSGTDYTQQTLSNVIVTKNAVTPQSITLVALPGSVAITLSTSDSAAVTPTFTVGGTTMAATKSGNVYTLSGIVPGSYTIVVSGTDYTQQTLSNVIVTKNAVTSQSTTLAALPGNVAITVTTSDSGAVTPTFTVGGVAKTATNSGNVYTLSGITPGSHTIVVSGAGYTSGTLNGVTVTKNATTNTSINLVVQPTGGSATITVTNNSGSPLANATVTVDGTALSGTTNGSGQVTISGIPAGSHTFTASVGGYSSNTSASISITVGNTSTTSIILMPTITAGKGRFIFNAHNVPGNVGDYRTGNLKVIVYDPGGNNPEISIPATGYGYYDGIPGEYGGFEIYDPNVGVQCSVDLTLPGANKILNAGETRTIIFQ